MLHLMMRGMSLTSELGDPNSPLVRFLARELPMASRVIGSLRGRLPLRPPTVRPRAAVPPDYRSLGRAIDRRLRVAFGSPVDSVLHGGVFLAGVDVAEAASGAAGSGQAIHSVGQALLSELKGQPAAHGGALTRSGEDRYRLHTVCFYLARQGQLVTWTIPEFLGLLGARRSLPELRQALRRELRDPAASPNVRQPGPSCGTQESLFSEGAED
ncbi:hypothetical protein [Streptomyces sp. NPDC046887]|uniref:hypothetical protein n=1 Tax=Streptomyces sp. NPDC046887 TaxID=3155472 RepID=UPI0033FC3C8E